MSDETEGIRRVMVAEINSAAAERTELEQRLGERVWSTDELRADFTVEGFMAPMVIVRRKSDGVRGTLFFQHDPRYYWGFDAE
jgi:hypothetical protein